MRQWLAEQPRGTRMRYDLRLVPLLEAHVLRRCAVPDTLEPNILPEFPMGAAFLHGLRCLKSADCILELPYFDRTNQKALLMYDPCALTHRVARWDTAHLRVDALAIVEQVRAATPAERAAYEAADARFAAFLPVAHTARCIVDVRRLQVVQLHGAPCVLGEHFAATVAAPYYICDEAAARFVTQDARFWDGAPHAEDGYVDTRAEHPRRCSMRTDPDAMEAMRPVRLVTLAEPLRLWTACDVSADAPAYIRVQLYAKTPQIDYRPEVACGAADADHPDHAVDTHHRSSRRKRHRSGDRSPHHTHRRTHGHGHSRTHSHGRRRSSGAGEVVGAVCTAAQNGEIGAATGAAAGDAATRIARYSFGITFVHGDGDDADATAAAVATEKGSVARARMRITRWGPPEGVQRVTPHELAIARAALSGKKHKRRDSTQAALRRRHRHVRVSIGERRAHERVTALTVWAAHSKRDGETTQAAAQPREIDLT